MLFNNHLRGVEKVLIATLVSILVLVEAVIVVVLVEVGLSLSLRKAWNRLLHCLSLSHQLKLWG